MNFVFAERLLPALLACVSALLMSGETQLPENEKDKQAEKGSGRHNVPSRTEIMATARPMPVASVAIESNGKVLLLHSIRAAWRISRPNSRNHPTNIIGMDYSSGDTIETMQKVRSSERSLSRTESHPSARK